MSDKKRVDVALVERGLAQSREKAQALVMSGVVYIGENKVDKASAQVTPEEASELRPTVLFVDEKNKVTKVTNYEKHGEIG